jgi:C4-dicarboxylate-specific signal transduction histidine kinase
MSSSLEDAHRELMQQQEQVISSNAKMSALGEMAGNIAHEINNPLAAIKSYAGQIEEVLGEEPFEKDLLLERAVKIEKTADRIAKIVRGLKVFSRDGSSDPFAKVHVFTMLDDTISFCGDRFRRYGVEMTMEQFDQGLTFEARETQISQVLLNLLNNAVDAIEKLEDKWIRVSVNADPTYLEIRITDSGPGIPPEVQKKMFQRYFTTKEVGKGTGMGLTISLGIVESHGGSLSIDGDCPNTCFLIRLPRSQKASSRVA